MTNQPLHKIFFIFSFIILFSILFSSQSLAQKDSSPAAIPQEKITENLKERLKNLIEDKTEKPSQKRAWVGDLTSIANNTLTIETREGPKLASISAETTYVRYPKRTKINLDDMAIGAYTIAMGYLNGNQVLNTVRVVVEEEPEEPPKRNVYFTTINQFDENTDQLQVSLDSDDFLIVELNKKSIISTQTVSSIEKTTTEAISKGQKAVIIVQSNVDNEHVLLRAHIFTQDQNETTTDPQIGPEIETASESATDSSI